MNGDGESEVGFGSLCTSAAAIGVSSSGSNGSLRLRNHAAAGATVLVIDIKGFTAGCAAMSAAQVGEWVADFYERVDTAAAAHGIRKAEVRGDCCICVAGTAAAVPWAEISAAARGPPAAADGRSDQVTRMLAFAGDLYAGLATLAYPGGHKTSARMGLATGDLTFLVGESGGGGGGGFVSVQGDAVRVATRMEALSEPGTVLLHRSAVVKWVAEGAGAGGGPRAPPRTVQVEGCDGEADSAAAYDCVARTFRRPAPGVPLVLPPRLKAAAPRSGFCLSFGARASEPPAKRSRARSNSVW
jgi:class 3 adenylate cyclase